eukprot:4721523-Pyramimonas_sp.AAC.1
MEVHVVNAERVVLVQGPLQRTTQQKLYTAQIVLYLAGPLREPGFISCERPWFPDGLLVHQLRPLAPREGLRLL